MLSELTASPPFLNSQRTLTETFFGCFTISTNFESLIQSLLKVDPHHRPVSCSQALDHPFFDKVARHRHNSALSLLLSLRAVCVADSKLHISARRRISHRPTRLSLYDGTTDSSSGQDAQNHRSG